METAKLKEYVKSLYELESSLYSQRKVYQEIDRNCNTIRYSYKRTEEIPHEEPAPENAKYVTTISIIFFMLLFLMVSCAQNGHSTGLFFILVTLFSSWVLGPIVGFIVGLAAKKIVELVRMKKQLKELEAVNRAIDRRNEEIRASNETNRMLARKKAEIMEGQLNEIARRIRETEKVLQQYYALGIIFEKYRNLVAISSIYEYLASGRCEELGGPHGAYNMYEEEVRQKMILDRLDDVLDSLSRIQSHQSMLYQAIQNGKFTLNQIQRELRQMSSGIQNIENNSQITAYNSRITAENTRFIKNLEIFKLLCD